MKHAIPQRPPLLQRLDRACSRMNSGLSAIAFVLAAAVMFTSVWRAAESVDRSRELANWPSLLMSTDGPQSGGGPLTEEQILGE